MKKMWIVMMAVCTALAFTACSKSNQNTETVLPSTAESAAKEETTTPPAEQEAPGSFSEFKILTGKVVAVSDTYSDMTLKKGDSQLKFVLDGVDIETSYAIDPDADITVIYKGEISGEDTSNAKVVLVLDAQEKMDIHEAVGSVKNQAMSSFAIQTDAGEEMSFLKDNCEGLSSGVLGQGSDESNGSGNMVKVTYVTVNYDAGSVCNFPLKVEAAE